MRFTKRQELDHRRLRGDGAGVGSGSGVVKRLVINVKIIPFAGIVKIAPRSLVIGQGLERMEVELGAVHRGTYLNLLGHHPCRVHGDGKYVAIATKLLFVE